MKLGLLMFLEFFEHRRRGRRRAGTPFLVFLFFLVWVAELRVVGKQLVPRTTVTATATPRGRFPMLLDEEFFGTTPGPQTERGRRLHRRRRRRTTAGTRGSDEGS